MTNVERGERHSSIGNRQSTIELVIPSGWYHAPMRHPLDEIKQLQAWRGRRGGDPSIARLVALAGDNAERTHRRLGQLIDLWQQLLPAEVASRTVLAGIRNGVLLVKVDSAATAFEVDRLL